MRNWTIILVSLALVLIVSFSAVAGGLDDVAVDDLDPPDEYEQLLERYKEMAEIALRYRDLYQEAEQDVIRLEQRAENLILQLERQQDLIEMQDELIDDLISQGDDNFFIVAGLNYLPVRNERQVYVGLQYRLSIPFF